MKYRKKPVVIDAWQTIQLSRWPEWVIEAERDDLLRVNLMEVWDYQHKTWIKYDLGDWIIRGIKGELYPCKDDIFKATYEKVEE